MNWWKSKIKRQVFGLVDKKLAFAVHLQPVNPLGDREKTECLANTLSHPCYQFVKISPKIQDAYKPREYRHQPPCMNVYTGSTSKLANRHHARLDCAYTLLKPFHCSLNLHLCVRVAVFLLPCNEFQRVCVSLVRHTSSSIEVREFPLHLLEDPLCFLCYL